uniref:RH47719p n=1 Tax=Drosophila melanogaster TaxID=7227 RepID=Q6NKL8_DROME|nr:RH52161p [Drosophila melanogaster]AAT09326.1 RH47719p [Drosophila melanogaster]
MSSARSTTAPMPMKDSRLSWTRRWKPS